MYRVRDTGWGFRFFVFSVLFTALTIGNAYATTVDPNEASGNGKIDIGQKDGISTQGSSHKVWIDHNEVYNSLSVDKDYYDELVSGKDQNDDITLSYKYLHDSWKSSLWGSCDADEYERRVTFPYNHYGNVNYRLPSLRFGQAHVINNYYPNALETGVNARIGARILVESNHFENVNNPIVSFYRGNLGYWDAADKLVENATWKEYPASGVIAGPLAKSTVSNQQPVLRLSTSTGSQDQEPLADECRYRQIERLFPVAHQAGTVGVPA